MKLLDFLYQKTANLSNILPMKRHRREKQPSARRFKNTPALPLPRLIFHRTDKSEAGYRHDRPIRRGSMSKFGKKKRQAIMRKIRMARG